MLINLTILLSIFALGRFTTQNTINFLGRELDPVILTWLLLGAISLLVIANVSIQLERFRATGKAARLEAWAKGVLGRK